MEKLSLYDLLSFLLPGSVVTVILWYGGTYYFALDTSQFVSEFNSVVFIAVSFFIGSVIHYMFSWGPVEMMVRRMGLYRSVLEIYDSATGLRYVKEFYEPLLESLKASGYTSRHQQMEQLWNVIYYKLEAEDKIQVPKSFQSFYFFFRNVAILAGIFLGVTAILLSVSLVVEGLLPARIPALSLVVVLAFVLYLSVKAGQMHRQKMIERMFWTYYSLYKI